MIILISEEEDKRLEAGEDLGNDGVFYIVKSAKNQIELKKMVEGMIKNNGKKCWGGKSGKREVHGGGVTKAEE